MKRYWKQWNILAVWSHLVIWHACHLLQRMLEQIQISELVNWSSLSSSITAKRNQEDLHNTFSRMENLVADYGQLIYLMCCTGIISKILTNKYSSSWSNIASPRKVSLWWEYSLYHFCVAHEISNPSYKNKRKKLMTIKSLTDLSDNEP